MPELDTRTARILLVDDDEFQRDVIGAQLASLGWHDVVYAENGEAALARYAEQGHHIDLLITDLSMPDMDGLVLMRHLVEQKFVAPVVLLSGVNDEILGSAAALATAHGLNILGVLPKPCDPQALADVLSHLNDLTAATGRTTQAETLTPARLALALAQNDFVPWYQPKIDVRSGKAMGVEALARWTPAGGASISPARFIPSLEAAGLIDGLFFCDCTPGRCRPRSLAPARFATQSGHQFVHGHRPQPGSARPVGPDRSRGRATARRLCH